MVITSYTFFIALRIAQQPLCGILYLMSFDKDLIPIP